MTVAVRAGVVFNGDPQPLGMIGTLSYTIHGSDPATLADGSATGIPALSPFLTGLASPLSPDYEYRSFALDGSAGLPTRGFLWAEAWLP
jgi:hypothetical protein